MKNQHKIVNDLNKIRFEPIIRIDPQIIEVNHPPTKLTIIHRLIYGWWYKHHCIHLHSYVCEHWNEDEPLPMFCWNCQHGKVFGKDAKSEIPSRRR